ncbi:MAG: hypothetical protein WC299_15010 [Kiritimatiellia bacterium]
MNRNNKHVERKLCMTPASACSAAASLARWAAPVPEIGRAVYRLTDGPREHKHAYYIFSPWSPDGRLLLLMRYDRKNPGAEICVMDTATGAISVAGRSRKWNSHSAALQQWRGAGGRILYVTGGKGEMSIVTVIPDGSGERVFPSVGLDNEVCCSPDGRWLYGVTLLAEIFPGDEITSRHDKGLIRMDLETGAQELVFSIEQALVLLPDALSAASCHLYIKRIIPHPRLPRLIFTLTNTFWDIDGKEPRIRWVMSVGTDGSAPACAGEIRHHSNWHPIEERIVANMRDGDGMMRFRLYRGDGRGLPEDVPSATGSGHPSFSPDGRWLCTDGAGPHSTQVVLCDPRTGRVTIVADPNCVSGGYPSFKAIRERTAGETVMDALERAAAKSGETWQTQAHPVWSRDGSAVLFNADLGHGSQLYAVDVERMKRYGFGT